MQEKKQVDLEATNSIIKVLKDESKYLSDYSLRRIKNVIEMELRHRKLQDLNTSLKGE
jgi:hypothetical protein